ncbi:MarR family winged helix-turn-helix transcriptional regulator [Nocardia sp. CA-128927]|uniref:MarR family winged helix-turn-helix transcriptional regulator n=1 Tax=Nocardia sp. CA-128927 TaxID=3239975 RepID=UPI003D97CD89
MPAPKRLVAPDPREITYHVMRQILQEHTAVWNSRIPDLTKPQLVVMTALARNPGIDQVTTSRLALVDTATLGGVVLRLEKRGLIARDPDPEDRRRYLLRLTDEGKATLRSAGKKALKLDAELLARLEPDEQQQLFDLLTKLSTPRPAETK